MALSKEAAEAAKIVRNYDGPKIRVMEVCGTHTHEIFRLGIRQMLPESIELISGPGCPVCVTPVGYIDEAVMLALEKGVKIFTFGDLIRVPGTKKSLADARSEGAEVQIVYSPMDALDYAKAHPEEEVCFLSVGFETTTPGSVIALRNAISEKVENFSLLTANKIMEPAYLALKGSADAFLYPGHVSTMTGMEVYRKIAKGWQISGVVTGFTTSEIVTALATVVRRVEEVRAGERESFAENCYPSVVTEEGSPAARKLVDKYMERCDTEWRGLGIIPGSGMKLRDEFSKYDARVRFQLPKVQGKASPACRCGEVLRGLIRPMDCKIYGNACTPEHPVGACMVSSEGACSAYYKYGDTLKLK